MNAEKPNEYAVTKRAARKGAAIQAVAPEASNLAPAQKPKDMTPSASVPRVTTKPAAPKPAPKGGVKKAAPKRPFKKLAPLVSPPSPPAAPPPTHTVVVNKAEFVREQPRTLPAKEVVAAGARIGITLTPDYVHKVRSYSKPKPAAPRPAAPARKPTPVAKSAVHRRPQPAPVSSRVASGHAEFRRLVLELGLQRARNLMAEVERKLNALIAGH